MLQRPSKREATCAAGSQDVQASPVRSGPHSGDVGMKGGRACLLHEQPERLESPSPWYWTCTYVAVNEMYESGKVCLRHVLISFSAVSIHKLSLETILETRRTDDRDRVSVCLSSLPVHLMITAKPSEVEKSLLTVFPYHFTWSLLLNETLTVRWTYMMKSSFARVCFYS